MSFNVTALPGANFGGLVTAPMNAADIVSAAEAGPGALPSFLDQFGGFLLIKGIVLMMTGGWSPRTLLKSSQNVGIKKSKSPKWDL